MRSGEVDVAVMDGLMDGLMGPGSLHSLQIGTTGQSLSFFRFSRVGFCRRLGGTASNPTGLHVSLSPIKVQGNNAINVGA
jgi:hypothetical protein